MREESNTQACLRYKARIDTIKKSMIQRNAVEEQFNELKKIEKIYDEIKNSIK